MDDDGRTRCDWAAGGSQLLSEYHDHEWGRPLRGRVALFERLTLEAFQSGLSWLIILRKRENFRRAFAGLRDQAGSTAERLEALHPPVTVRTLAAGIGGVTQALMP